jgi:lipopolysaccharide export system permease protein
MKLVNQLIRVSVWQALMVVILAVMGIFFIVLLIGELGNIGTAHYGMGLALAHSFLLLPAQVYALLPMLGFLAALLGLGHLSAQNELVAVRAAGMSRWKITLAVMQAAIIVIVLVTVVGEGFAFKWVAMANRMKSTALMKQVKDSSPSNFWVRGHDAMIYVKKAPTTHTLADVTVFHFNHHGELTSMVTAPNATALLHGWALHHAQVTTIGTKSIRAKTVSTIALPIDFTPVDLKADTQDPSALSLSVLWHGMAYRWQHHLSPNQVSFAFWLRVFQPISALIMIWLGVPFMFGSLRDSTLGFRLIVGLLLGFGLYMFNQVIGPFCMLYEWPPIIAGIIPSGVLLLLGFILFQRTR